ncbi:MAG: hypothetical protein ACRD6I_09880, partial [Candidatus Acidiferrales bacterium]
QEAMCQFLECTPAPKGAPFDFSRGSRRFEFKHSSLLRQHPADVEKGKRKQAEFCWQWQNLFGHSGAKIFDFIILEGEWHKGTSRYFMFSYEDFVRFFGRRHVLACTASQNRKTPGKTQKVLLDHEYSKNDLKQSVLGLTKEGAEFADGPRCTAQFRMGVVLAG